MKLMLALCLFVHSVAVAQFSDSPFAASALLTRREGTPALAVTLTIPEHHYLYADQISIRATDGTILTPVLIPAPHQKEDPFLGQPVAVYDHTTTFTYTLSDTKTESIQVEISYQGCSSSLCFMPQTKRLTVTAAGADILAPPTPLPASEPEAAPTTSWRMMLRDAFTTGGRADGYLRPTAFIKFLNQARTGDGQPSDALSSAFRRNVWLALLLILAGGLALNLTPCVLPMIPINIAIIGAGAKAGSRLRGLALGATYGAGMALVYGTLGLAAVLTGARFGSLNSSPVFNLAIALVFLLMALAMVDVIRVDLSRFQTRAAPATPGSCRFVTAFVMGGIAALLAGACVAPVVISVILLAADVYGRGNPAGLILPFLLGLGMALPWPFAGAGLSFLPKPGKWMERVKVVFALLILAMALYYGHLAFTQLHARRPPAEAALATAGETQGADEAHGWLTGLDTGLREASQTGRPLLLDFWASWCKNCVAMDRTTFRDPAVLKELELFVKAKVDAEDLRDPETIAMLDAFEIKGLPAYVVLRPRPNAKR